jgi:hypothetical protein
MDLNRVEALPLCDEAFLAAEVAKLGATCKPGCEGKQVGQHPSELNPTAVRVVTYCGACGTERRTDATKPQ